MGLLLLRWERQESNQSHWSPGKKGAHVLVMRPSNAIPSPILQHSSASLAFDTAGSQSAPPEALQENTANQQRDRGDQGPRHDQIVDGLGIGPRIGGRHIPTL